MMLARCTTAMALVLGLGYGLAAEAQQQQSQRYSAAVVSWWGACHIGPETADPKQRFGELDKDGDGQISKAEFVDCYIEQKAEQEGTGRAEAEASLGEGPRSEIDRQYGEADRDQSGGISQDEYVTMVTTWELEPVRTGAAESAPDEARPGATGAEQAPADPDMAATGVEGVPPPGRLVEGPARQADGRSDAEDRGRPAPAREAGAADTGSRLGDDVDDVRGRAGEIIGKRVVNLNGDELGEIDELVIDPASNKVSAVIDIGGFLGIGDRPVAIPLGELQLTGDEAILMSRETRESLERRPAFDSEVWPRITE